VLNSKLETEILKILLSPPHEEDTTVRKIAKKLDCPVSHVFYYLKKMAKQGILIKEEYVRGSGCYTPHAIFTDNIETTKTMLRKISKGIDDSTEDKLANCIRLFLKFNKL